MAEDKNDSNSGVQALNGFAFQRNAVIYLILENYDILLGDRFFVCIEHHDDFLFVHTDSKSKIYKVDSYQAKKATNSWSTNQKLATILAKMTLVAKGIRDDPMPKADGYNHNLIFLTNKKINLKCGAKNEPKYSSIVKEDNVFVLFSGLHEKIRENIESKLASLSFDEEEIDNISFRYVDVANTDKSQRQQLVGMISNLFADTVSDPAAALDLLLTIFQDIETVYNQGENLSFLDVSKRIYSDEIFKAFDVICSKAKAYKFWRDNAAKLSEALEVPVRKSRDYVEKLSNCFDYFKDLSQVEFVKIYRFVAENDHVDDLYYTDIECVKNLNELYLKEKSSQLDSVTVAFAIVAAYVETRDVK